MSELTPHLTEFLVTRRQRLKDRGFLINILTKTGNRPEILLSPASMEAVKSISGTGKVFFLEHSLSQPVYPDLKSVIPPEQAKALDPMDAWIYEHNLPRIKSESDALMLMREYQNWSCLPDEEKAITNKSSVEMRGCEEFQALGHLLQSGVPKKEDYYLVELVDDQTADRVLAYIEPNADYTGFTVDVLSDTPEERLMTEVDTFTLSPGQIECRLDGPVLTTVGRFIVNYLFLAYPFGDQFSYVNQEIILDNGDIIDTVTKARDEGKLDIMRYMRFMDNVYFLGHFTELCTPCLSERALSTDPNLRARKQELLKQNAEHINDPLVIANIEKELIAMDKAYIKGDVSERFYKPLGKKSMDLWRKKTYIAVGGIEAFSKDSSKYLMIKNSLEEGMNLEDLPKYGNESRKGSYQRGHETRNGGALTKYIIRAFHDSRITEEDCGTKRGVEVDFTKHEIKKFRGRSIWYKGGWTVITGENMKEIPPGKYVMRSPQYCTAKNNGYCYACMGRLYAEMGLEQLTMTAVDISTTFMNASMKNMHGSNVSTLDISSVDAFIL